MRRVVIESPFAVGPEIAGDLNDQETLSLKQRLHRLQAQDLSANRMYLHDVGRYLCLRGDAPYASHMVLTRFLDDNNERERKLGIDLGLVWGACAQHTVVAIDRGISRGMEYGIAAARNAGRTIEWLSLAVWATTELGRNDHFGRKKFEASFVKPGDLMIATAGKV